LRNAIIAVLAYDRASTLWDAARLLSVGEEGYAYRRSVGARVRTLPEFNERPNFFDVSVYGASADSVARYTRKGSRIGIDGRLEWREWEAADQQRRQAVSVVAEVVQFLDGPRGGGAEDDLGSGNGGEEGELVVVPNHVRQ
jgi:single stranded DNA-binding protein